MSVRCTVATASPVAKAVQVVLAKAGVEYTESTKFSVTVFGQTFVGISPIVTVLNDDVKNANLFGVNAEQRAAVAQWTGLATHVAAEAADLADVESLLPQRLGFLADSPTATMADALMYAVTAEQVMAAPKQFPKLHKWVLLAAKDDLVGPLRVAAAAGSPSAGTAQDAEASGVAKAKTDKGKSGGYAKPSDEEIAARRKESALAKAEKKALKDAQGHPGAAEPAAAAPAAPASSGIDLRVGIIRDVKRHESADRLFVETIDLGEAEPRTIVSGLVAHYTAEELRGRSVVVVCNMKPRLLQGVASNGMVLCACSDAVTRLIEPASSVPVGTRVSIGGEMAEAPPPVNKKILEVLASLRTDSSGNATWGDKPLLAGDISVVSPLAGVIIK